MPLARHPVVAFATSTDFRQDPRAVKVARALVARGYDVHVFAWDRFHGSSRERTSEGMEVRRHGPRSRPGTGLRQLPGMLAFWVQAWAGVIRLRPAIIHCNRLDTLLPFALLSQLLGAALVYDPHMDLVGRLSVHDGQPGMSLLRRGLGRAEGFLLSRWVTLAIGDSAPAAERLARRGGRKVVAVENAPPLDFAGTPGSETNGTPLTVGRIGAFSAQLGQGAEDLLEVGATCPPDLDLQLLMVGNFVPQEYAEEVRERAAGLRCPVEILGYVPHAEIRDQYARLHIMVVRYEVDGRAGYSRYSSAQKVLEAMACGIPIVISASPLLESLVEGNGCGIVADSPDPADIARAVFRLARDGELRRELGTRGREAFRSHHAWEFQMARLLPLYPT